MIGRAEMLPADAVSYRRIGPFDEHSLPSGLLREHQLKEDVWAVLTMVDGTIGFAWDDDDGGEVDLTAPATLVIPPSVPHHVDLRGPFTLTIEFHRRP
ncbi:MAG TPA: DUF1971 domain-containing protein [Sphingomicrobium sp.]|nr:DUF1971 domain-containing protein [Sphingomicrobium sp.]